MDEKTVRFAEEAAMRVIEDCNNVILVRETESRRQNEMGLRVGLPPWPPLNSDKWLRRRALARRLLACLYRGEALDGAALTAVFGDETLAEVPLMRTDG